MDDARSPDPSVSGPLTREAARAHLERGVELLASGDFDRAAAHFSRVVGFDDPEITAAGLLGLGEARYRMDDEAARSPAGPPSPSSPRPPPPIRRGGTWRRRGSGRRPARRHRRLPRGGRRAPAEDKAEIANRLGWLSKETGDTGASRRYFARAAATARSSR